MKKTANKQLWVERVGENYRLGLTNEGQEELGDVSFVTLPLVGQELKKGDSFADVEAEKAVTELSTPLAGKVNLINEAAEETPSLLDDKEYKNAWLIELSAVDGTEFDKL